LDLKLDGILAMVENLNVKRRSLPADIRRTIEGLRDTGYNTNMAVADIVDNSIAAGASEIRIQIALQTNKKIIAYFGDDGHGMDEIAVEGAMTYGSPERAIKKSLGKFGLGLKTASSSMCRRYSVLSKSGENDQFATLTWDLDHVQEVGDWEVLEVPVSDEDKEAFNELCGPIGTLVKWEKCDRLLGRTRSPDHSDAKVLAGINKIVKNLDEHLATYFHRFLDPDDDRAPNVKMFVNGSPVIPWNPFAPGLSESSELPVIEAETADGNTSEITMTGWFLPHKNDCNKDQQKLVKHANNKQGFWIFRESRLIQSGTWADIGLTQEPHYSLLRVEFDFTHELDEAFDVDVKKSKIQIDPGLAEELSRQMRPLRREAQARHRQNRVRTTQTSVIGSLHRGANVAVQGTAGVARPVVLSANEQSQTAELENSRGRITIKVPVSAAPRTKDVVIRTVDDILDGQLWHARIEKDDDGKRQIVVLLNQHHDFYTKIYRAASTGTATGIDLLIWSLVNAEYNNATDELTRVFDDLRDEISMNLKKLLHDFDIADLDDSEDEEIGND